MSKKRELQLSDEERERRRQNMLRLQEEGKVGPQFGKLGGRPRKPRANEMVAEAAKKNADKIIKVFEDGVVDDSMKTRLAAATSWLTIEHEETRLQIEEERHELDLANADRNELIEFLADALTQGRIAEQLGDVIEGQAITDVELVGLESTEENGDSGEEL